MKRSRNNDEEINTKSTLYKTVDISLNKLFIESMGGMEYYALRGTCLLHYCIVNRVNVVQIHRVAHWPSYFKALYLRFRRAEESLRLDCREALVRMNVVTRHC